MLRVEQDEKDS